MNGQSQEGAVGGPQLPLGGRKPDFPSLNSNESVQTQNSSFNQGFRGSSAPWSQNGIWGNNAGASSAYTAAKDQTRSKESTFGSSDSTAFDSIQGSSSLLSSSQAHNWTATNTSPWNNNSSKSPALATIRPVPTSNGSGSNSRPLDPTSQPSDSLRTTSPYFANRQIVGPSIPASQSSRKSATLDPTSGPFVAGWTPESNKSTGFGVPADWNQSFRASDAERESLSGRSFDGDHDRLGQSSAQDDFATSQMLGGTGSSAASRSGSIPPRRNISSSGGGQYGAHLGSTLNQQPFSQTSNPLGSGRSFHSPHNSSYSSHSQAPRSDISDSDARSVQMAAALGSMYLDSDGSTATSFAASSSHANQARQGPNMHQTRLNLNSAYSNGLRPFTPEGYPESQSRDYVSMQRRADGVGAPSPTSSDQLHGLQGPYYSVEGTPPAIGDEVRAPSRGSSNGRYHHQNNSHIPQANVVLLERKLRGIQQEQQAQQSFFYSQQNPLYMRADAFRGQYNPNIYDFNSQNAMRLGQFAPYVPIQPIRTPTGGPAAPRGPSRDHDSVHNLICPLMQEFRSNSKTSKRYELKDIYGHVVEFSGDQHGSRFIQQKLETANSDEKEQIFREIKPNALQLMTDVFGNYVIQKFFEHGNQHQKSVLADQMKGHVLTLSLQMYGCRVVQKAIEHILLDQQILSVKELEANVMKCIKDQNGNHVIQKAIERVPQEHIQFVVEAVTGQVQSLAVHNYGCRVIQRLLEHTNDATQHVLLQELHTCTYTLILDPYGNYVVQHIISNGKPEDRRKVIDIVAAHVMIFSKNKCGSNVVERCMRAATKEQLRQILETVVSSKSDASNSLALMKDQFGNYVIQSILHILKGQQLEDFVDLIGPHLTTLKKFSYGKQIAAIEKIISTLDIPRNRTPPLEASAAATPPLLPSIDAQSPPSTSHPSTANSTIDGPTVTSISSSSPPQTSSASLPLPSKGPASESAVREVSIAAAVAS